LARRRIDISAAQNNSAARGRSAAIHSATAEPGAPGLVRRAARYIPENAGAAISVPDVVRLAHAELCRSGEEIDVTALALLYGFTQLGLSAPHQTTFRELPTHQYGSGLAVRHETPTQRT